MSLKSKFFITFLIIATVLSGAYCIIAAFYAPLFFRDSFLVDVHVKKNPSDDLGKKDIFFPSHLYKSQRSNNTKKIPNDNEQLQKLLNEGWRIVHRFTGYIVPLWIQKNGTPVIPSHYKTHLYGFLPVYFYKTQSPDIRSSPSGYWGFIIPDFDCELAFLIIPSESGNILFYPTGIRRNDMIKERQKARGENSTFTQIDIPNLETLMPPEKPILDFMEKDNFFRKFLHKKKTLIPSE